MVFFKSFLLTSSCLRETANRYNQEQETLVCKVSTILYVTVIGDKDPSVGSPPNAISERSRGIEEHPSVFYQTGTPLFKVALEEHGLELHRSHAVSNGPVQVKLLFKGQPHGW